MNEDAGQRWVLLIDELPIFLKALHDRGPEGIVEARAFMNFVSRMREAHPRIRWLITGSPLIRTRGRWTCSWQPWLAPDGPIPPCALS